MLHGCTRVHANTHTQTHHSEAVLHPHIGQTADKNVYKICTGYIQIFYIIYESWASNDLGIQEGSGTE